MVKGIDNKIFPKLTFIIILRDTQLVSNLLTVLYQVDSDLSIVDLLETLDLMVYQSDGHCSKVASTPPALNFKHM